MKDITLHHRTSKRMMRPGYYQITPNVILMYARRLTCILERSEEWYCSAPVLPPQHVHRVSRSHEAREQGPEQAMGGRSRCALLRLRRVGDQGRQLHGVPRQHSKPATVHLS